MLLLICLMKLLIRWLSPLIVLILLFWHVALSLVAHAAALVVPKSHVLNLFLVLQKVDLLLDNWSVVLVEDFSFILKWHSILVLHTLVLSYILILYTVKPLVYSLINSKLWMSIALIQVGSVQLAVVVKLRNIMLVTATEILWKPLRWKVTLRLLINVDISLWMLMPLIRKILIMVVEIIVHY